MKTKSEKGGSESWKSKKKDGNRKGEGWRGPEGADGRGGRGAPTRPHPSSSRAVVLSSAICVVSRRATHKDKRECVTRNKDGKSKDKLRGKKAGEDEGRD